MRRSRLSISLAVAASAIGLGLVFVGCDAGSEPGGSLIQDGDDDDDGSGGEAGAKGQGEGGSGASDATTVGVTVGGGNDSSSTGVPVNPCGTECGPVELCDGINKGIDDNCDGTVDEDCPCAIGQASDCFKGDPSYRNAPGCFPGTMQCTEFGSWGSCEGGAHAYGDEPCQTGSLEGCHPISAVPFATTDLLTGTGVFSQDADAGSNLFEVACPVGIEPCPQVNGTQFQALQSGEYTVTYTKQVDGETESCTFPLNVGAPGLRVELSWNHEGSTNADYDLHMLQPGSTLPFDDSGDLFEDPPPQDCGFQNCTVDNALAGTAPPWFVDDPNAPEGTPVRWYSAPDPTQNTCYYSPRGVGAEWAGEQRGCHNPRLDLDNISCDPGVTDVDDPSFCAPENINVDVPPMNTWTRLAVKYYDFTSDNEYPVRPNVKIFCNGSLAASLGTQGFYDPERAVEQNLSSNGSWWYLADVMFRDVGDDECADVECVVNPIYADPNARTPLLDQAEGFGPAYPPMP